jgi:hypothetical protein
MFLDNGFQPIGIALVAAQRSDDARENRGKQEYVNEAVFGSFLPCMIQEWGDL